MRQDICHLWVLKCKSQQTLFPATFFLLDVQCIFQASRGWALSRGCRRSGHSGLQDTLGAQSQSQRPLGSLPRPPRLHNQVTPSPHSRRPTSRPKAISTRRGIISRHDHGEGKDPNSIAWGGEEVRDLTAEQDPLGSSVLLEIPASGPSLCCSLYLRHPFPPNSHHSLPLPFQVSAASSRQPSLTTRDLHRCPSSLSLSSRHSPPPMLPLPLWEGRSCCWSVSLPLQAVSSIEPWSAFHSP